MKTTVYDYTDERPHVKFLIIDDKRGPFFNAVGDRVSVHSINGDADQYEIRWTVRPETNRDSELKCLAIYGLKAVKFTEGDILMVPLLGRGWRMRITQVGTFSGTPHYGFMAFLDAECVIGWMPCKFIDEQKGVCQIAE